MRAAVKGLRTPLQTGWQKRTEYFRPAIYPLLRAVWRRPGQKLRSKPRLAASPLHQPATARTKGPARPPAPLLRRQEPEQESISHVLRPRAAERATASI